jgi:hypothetical protein
VISLRDLVIGAVLLLAGVDALAGATCDRRTATPAALAAAAQTALQVRDALDRRDEPIALLARVGTDLSKQGLVYSHVAVVQRESDSPQWRVVHLLNECGTQRSEIYREGLVNFFADDLVRQDARIVWLRPAWQAALQQALGAGAARRVHEPHYSLIARPGSMRYQNSTAWLLELIAAARGSSPYTRTNAHAELARWRFEPDVVRISYGKRVLGGLFGANTVFTDHPVGTRLSGRYPVVTVRAVVCALEAQDAIAAQLEWRNGATQAVLGPL